MSARRPQGRGREWFKEPPSAAERRLVRLFAGSCGLNALIVLLGIVAAARGLPFSTAAPALYRVLLLWSLAVSAYAFYSLLRLARETREELSRMSLTDELTGVFNFRYLDQRLQEEQERTRRYGGSTAVLFLDFDCFKEVNDRYGHQVGNCVLRGLAAAMRRHVRASDVLGRLGGDEFLVILPQSTPEQARALAERLRKTVENYRLKISLGRFVDFVRVSIGLASYPENGDSVEAVVMAADRAVYQAKRRGGNAVCASEEFIGTAQGGRARTSVKT